MKKKALGFCVVMAFALIVMSCVSGPDVDAPLPDGQSMIIVERGNSADMLKATIWIDGKEVGSVKKNTTAVLYVENGEHTIQTRFSTIVGKFESAVLTFTANGGRYTFYTYVGGDRLFQQGITLTDEKPYTWDK